MALIVYGVRTKGGASITPQAYIAGAAITAPDFVVRATDDGYVDSLADNAVLCTGLALNTTTAAGETVYIIEGGDGVIFRTNYVGTVLTVTSYGDYIGTDGATIDMDNTSNKLFRLVKVGTFPDGTTYCDVEIPDALCDAHAEIS